MENMDHHDHHQTSENSTVEYLKFAGVILLIIVATVVLHNSLSLEGWMEWLRIFMGVFLAVFAAFKFAGYKMFVVMFTGYDLIARRFKVYSYAYPFIEASLALMFLFGIAPVFRSVTVLIIMGIGAVGVFQEIYHRRSGVYCACLGNIIKLPLSTVSLVENVTMVAMALVMIISGAS